MFNWLTVIILVPIESATGLLETVTAAMVASLGNTSGSSKPPDFLKVLTNPFTKAIIQLDKKVRRDKGRWGEGSTRHGARKAEPIDNVTLL